MKATFLATIGLLSAVYLSVVLGPNLWVTTATILASSAFVLYALVRFHSDKEEINRMRSEARFWEGYSERLEDTLRKQDTTYLKS